jgi:predicted phage tail protein
MAKVTLHGKLAESVGEKEWKVNVSSVGEALHAINIQSGEGIKRFFSKRENAYAEYSVLINGEEIAPSKDFKNNELTINRKDITEIDIVPILEGKSLGFLGIILGLGGMGFAQTNMGMLTAIMMLATGISTMLAKPPKMPEQRQILNPSSDPSMLANSYLYNGAVNVMNEGGPVPIGYGRMIVGSQVIMNSYDVRKVLVREAGRRR